jgi:ADP-heptose:LPS heptosyltransferase
MKIALVQPGCFGDNINSTMMLKPLKEAFKCELHVHTSDIYRSAFDNNPYIDRVIEYQATSKNGALNLVHVIPGIIKNDGYDKILNPHPMINGDKWTSTTRPELGTNLMLAWVRCLEDLGVKVPDKLESVLRWTNEELDRVEAKWAKYTTKGRRNILMEVAHESGQSFWNADWTTKVGAYLLHGRPRSPKTPTNLFISRKDHTHEIDVLKKQSNGCHVAFIGDLSVRECAAFYNKCDMFFCVSSGLTNACNTDLCRTDIKWIETVNSPTVTSAPIRSDGKIFWHNTNIAQFLSMLEESGI